MKYLWLLTLMLTGCEEWLCENVRQGMLIDFHRMTCDYAFDQPYHCVFVMNRECYAPSWPNL